jgi:hypothetical protein
MPVNAKDALSQLAKLQKVAKSAKARALSAKETSEERAEYVYHSAVRFGSAAAAGAADAMVDDTLAGMTPSELGGLTLGALSLSGMLGSGTKTARSAAEGALCGAAYRRSFTAFRGEGASAELPAPGAVAGHVGGPIDDAEHHDILVALQEESETGLRDADFLVD